MCLTEFLVYQVLYIPSLLSLYPLLSTAWAWVQRVTSAHAVTVLSPGHCGGQTYHRQADAAGSHRHSAQVPRSSQTRRGFLLQGLHLSCPQVSCCCVYSINLVNVWVYVGSFYWCKSDAAKTEKCEVIVNGTILLPYTMICPKWIAWLHSDCLADWQMCQERGVKTKQNTHFSMHTPRNTHTRRHTHTHTLAK